MKTFKVTFFDRYDILSVETFHNVENQGAFCRLVASRIVTQGIAPFIRCEAEGKDYTEVMNAILKWDIADLEKNYTINYLTNIGAL